MPDDRSRRIRVKAYYIWEEQGRLNGSELIETKYGLMRRQDLHWKTAERIINYYDLLQGRISKEERDRLKNKAIANHPAPAPHIPQVMKWRLQWAWPFISRT